MVGFLLIFLIGFDPSTNYCCGDSAVFSPEHKLTIYSLIGLFEAGYWIASVRTRLLAPGIEVLVNTLLLGGFAFNLFIGIQIGDFIALIGNTAVGLLFLNQLLKNHYLFWNWLDQQFFLGNSFKEQLFREFLGLHFLVKMPVFLLLLIPLLTIVTSILLIFGQQPDSIVRAFTDTYHHTFSQWSYMCDNVACGGHYLCSVAANGSPETVKPIRYGERNGHRIICNRQLLVANAFEEIIQKKLPGLHRVIRKNYDRVGDVIHQNYSVYEKKWVSNMMYVLMKPAEYFFTAFLYVFHRNPETLIHLQYLKPEDRRKIELELGPNGSFIV